MKISLIIPPFNLLKEGYGTKVRINRGNLPNLGILTIAAVLEAEGHEVKIIDAELEEISPETIYNRVKDSDIIGITITNAHYEAMKEMLISFDEFKGKIIVGGPHATCFPEKILNENGLIDYLVYGEGEITIKELVDCIEKKKSIKKVNGIYFRDKGIIKATEPRPPIKDLDTIPRPALHLVSMYLYSPLPDQYKVLPATSWVTSRGCTWRKCTFCFESAVHAQAYRRHSPRRVVDDIEWLQKEYGIREIDFFDDEFFINEKWVKEFCMLLHERNIELSWTAYGRADHITKPMLEFAKGVGCWGIYMGIETGNTDLLKVINKGITLRQVRKVCNWAHELDLEVRGSFMLGLPGETPKKAQKTIDFAIELGLSTAAFHLTYPEYGTKLYDTALEQGKLLGDKWIKRTKVAYLPDGYKDAEELERMQKRAFRQFYFRPDYIYKRLINIKTFSDLKREFKGFMFLLGLV